MNRPGPGRDQRIGGTSAISAAQSISRILREYREIKSELNPYWCAFPLDEAEPYEWHFTIRGPADSDFSGGVFHGRVVLPRDYPFGPPSVMMLTQNGRFEIGKKVCLSASNYHPELWQPAWGLRTMLDALHAFFPTPGEGALHSLDWPAEVRHKCSVDSLDWVCPTCNISNSDLVSKYCAEPTTTKPSLPDDVSTVSPSMVQRMREDIANFRSDDSEIGLVGASSQFLRNDNVPTTIVSDVLVLNENEAVPPNEPKHLQTISSNEPNLLQMTSDSPLNTIKERRRPPPPQLGLLQTFSIKLPCNRRDALRFSTDVALFLLAVLAIGLVIDLLIRPPTFVRFSNNKSN